MHKPTSFPIYHEPPSLSSAPSRHGHPWRAVEKDECLQERHTNSMPMAHSGKGTATVGARQEM